MIAMGAFASLEKAIHAALTADLDLNSTVIEVDGVSGKLTDWISIRIAGGDVRLG